MGYHLAFIFKHHSETRRETKEGAENPSAFERNDIMQVLKKLAQVR